MNHVGALRVSLLLALGAVPVACGGATSEIDDGGSGSGSGAGSDAGGTTGKMLPPRGGASSSFARCTNPQLDAASGLVRCAEGFSHRPKAIQCEGSVGLPSEPEPNVGGAGEVPAKPRATGSVVCREYDDYGVGGYGAGGSPPSEELCEQFEQGYCRDGYENFDPATCDSGCFTDADCGRGELCECGHSESPSGGVCIGTRNCKTDADCGPGNLCATLEHSCGGHTFACFSPKDECAGSKDCDGDACVDFGGVRGCEDGACGRPFLVECAARMAAVVGRRDWLEQPGRTPSVAHLTAEERRELARHWSRMGQLEHASIAAFARFQLQLLSLGAPPELVEACTSALADETAHTRLCFGIASAYAGRALGPGPLDVAGSLDVTSLVDIVALVIAEGCFGETVAALEAREAADAAADPVIRDAYRRIARDEQRHAELAFRFVRWALTQDRASVSSCIATALRTTDTRSDVLSAVVEPCFTTLLEAA